MQPQMDGRDRYTFGLAMPTAIMWQPRFGHEAIGHLNFLGAFYTLLIRIDRRFIHPTIYVSDDSGIEKAAHLPISKVHPLWRDDYVTDFKAITARDNSAHAIQCRLRLTGSDHPRTLTEIWISRELSKALGASAPSNFTEKSFEDYDKYHKEKYVRWTGKLPLLRDQEITLFVPTEHPSEGTGTIRFQCELSEQSQIYSTKTAIVKLQSQLP